MEYWPTCIIGSRWHAHHIMHLQVNIDRSSSTQVIQVTVSAHAACASVPILERPSAGSHLIQPALVQVIAKVTLMRKISHDLPIHRKLINF